MKKTHVIITLRPGVSDYEFEENELLDYLEAGWIIHDKTVVQDRVVYILKKAN